MLSGIEYATNTILFTLSFMSFFSLPTILVAIIVSNKKRKAYTTEEDKQAVYEQGYRAGYASMMERMQVRSRPLEKTEKNDVDIIAMPQSGSQHYQSPLATMPVAAHAANPRPALSDEEVEEMRQRKTERAKNRLVNSALYVGVSLVVAGFVVSVFTAGIIPTLQFFLLLFFGFAYYVAGAVLYKKITILRSVAWAFMLTGMIAVPIVGVSLYSLLPVDPTLVWLGISVVTLMLYVHAFFCVRKPVVLYAITGIGMWVAMSFVASLELSTVWYFIAGFVYVSMVTVIRSRLTGLRKRFAMPIKQSEVAIGSVLALVALVSGMTQVEVSIAFFFASVYCITTSLFGGWSRSIQRIFINVARLLLQITVVSGILGLTDDPDMAVWAWITITTLQVAYSILQEKVRPGSAINVHTIWIGLGMASILFAGLVYGAGASMLATLAGAVLVALLSFAALARIRVWYYLFGLAIAGLYIGWGAISLVVTTVDAGLFYAGWLTALMLAVIAAAYYIHEMHYETRGKSFVYLAISFSVYLYATLEHLLNIGWIALGMAAVYVLLIGVMSHASKVRSLLYVGLGYLVPASFIASLSFTASDTSLYYNASADLAYTVCVSFIVGAILLWLSMWLVWRKQCSFMTITTDIILATSILYASIAAFLPLTILQAICMVAILLLAVMASMYRIVHDGSTFWIWGVYWLLFLTVVSMTLRLEWGADMQLAMAIAVWVVGMMALIAVVGLAKKVPQSISHMALLAPGYAISAFCLTIGMLWVDSSMALALVSFSAVVFALQLVLLASHGVNKMSIYVTAIVAAALAPLRVALLLPGVWPAWLWLTIFAAAALACSWLYVGHNRNGKSTPHSTFWLITGLIFATLAALVSFGANDSTVRLLSFVQFVSFVLLGVVTLRALVAYWSIGVLTLLVLAFAWSYGPLALSSAGTIVLVSVGALVYRQEKHRSRENKLKKDKK